MSIKIDAASAKVAYHVEDGAMTFPYAVDAHSAVSRFPNEWSFTPWSKDGGRTAPVVEIPPDWQDQSPSSRIALALALSGEPRKGMTAAKADDIILAEVERREEEPAPEPAPAPVIDPRKSPLSE
jgi:hypothetical protein